MSLDDRWGEMGPVTRRSLLALSAASLFVTDDADARKRRKKHRRKRKKGGKGGGTANNGIIRPSRWTQSQLDSHVQAAYERWKSRYLVAVDGSQYRVAFSKSGANHGATVSEGQGFGLMIVSTMAGYDPEARSICEGLSLFVRAHPSEIEPRLMDWHVPGGNGNTSAFDGDADIAYGLLLAASRWGNDGLVAFRTEFDRTLAGIRERTIGPQSRLPMLGDWVDPNGSKHNQYTPRSSDLMPGHFHTWARATGDAFWTQVAVASQNTVAALQSEYSPVTGLLPDFIEPRSAQNHRPRPASPGFLEGPNDGNYNYNAGRDPWRIGADAILHKDATSAAQAAKIARWARATTNGDPRAFKSGYYLDGRPLPDSDYFSVFFVAPLGIAAMCDAGLQDWLDDIYAAVIATTDQDYYEESVALLCLLLMTGNFRDPTR
jgi:endoglucanase